MQHQGGHHDRLRHRSVPPAGSLAWGLCTRSFQALKVKAKGLDRSRNRRGAVEQIEHTTLNAPFRLHRPHRLATSKSLLLQQRLVREEEGVADHPRELNNMQLRNYNFRMICHKTWSALHVL